MLDPEYLSQSSLLHAPVEVCMSNLNCKALAVKIYPKRQRTDPAIRTKCQIIVETASQGKNDWLVY